MIRKVFVANIDIALETIHSVPNKIKWNSDLKPKAHDMYSTASHHKSFFHDSQRLLAEPEVRITKNQPAREFSLSEAFTYVISMHSKTAFCIPGGPLYPLLDKIADSDLSLCRLGHEQSLAHAAEGYSFATGECSFVLVTSGPGATNLLTGLSDAWMDHRPIIAIAGQVPRNVVGTRAFQEVDITSMASPVCKRSVEPLTAEEAIDDLIESIRIAKTPPMGPCIISITKDLWSKKVYLHKLDSKSSGAHPSISTDVVDSAFDALMSARRPMILIGKGISAIGASKILPLAERLKMPVASTLHGLGGFPARHPQWCGMVGMHGTRRANHALSETDVLLALGARLDDRVVGNSGDFLNIGILIHVNLDIENFGRVVTPDFPVCMDTDLFIEKLNSLPDPPKETSEVRLSWASHLREFPDATSEPGYRNPKSSAANLFMELNKHISPDDIVVADVGQHQMWTAQFIDFMKPCRFLTSGGLGTMGFALPAAIGICVADPKAQLWCITGDGGMVMSLHDLGSLSEMQCNIRLVVVNNKGLGMVKQWQDLFFGRRIISDFDFDWKFTKIANALGIPGATVSCASDLRKQLTRKGDLVSPFMIEVMIPESDCVFPLVPPGLSNQDMIPKVEL